MRRFTPEYLETTRQGMWDDSREVLRELDLAKRERVLDVGAGTGELTRVLHEEVSGDVYALDADSAILSHAPPPRIVGDATELPFPDGTFDLVICQALLVNLPNPIAAIEEFARVSNDTLAVIEPDNSAVEIESTVESEAPLAKRARSSFLDGVETDVTLGSARQLFLEAGLDDISVHQYDHVREIDPPYSQQALESAQKKASGDGLETDRETILAGETTTEEYDQLRQKWRAMGRDVIEQMQADEYRHREVVPFFLTIGSV